MKGTLHIVVKTDDATNHKDIIEHVFEDYQHLKMTARFTPEPMQTTIIDMDEVEAKVKGISVEQLKEEKAAEEAALVPKV